MDFVDLYGAPELFVEAVYRRELVCTDLMRLTLGANEGGQCIVRLKMLMPIRRVLHELENTQAFLAGRIDGEAAPVGRLLH